VRAWFLFEIGASFSGGIPVGSNPRDLCHF
jgi:hypothetical protein